MSDKQKNLMNTVRKIKGIIKDKIYDTKRFNKCNSFSQMGEDVIVCNLLKGLGRKEVSYLDIGCNHPYRFNNTVLLSENFEVKNGVLVEPNVELTKFLKKKRKKDLVLNVGVCGNDDECGDMKYYMFDASTLNTFSQEEAQDTIEKGYKLIDTKTVEVISINKILRDHFADGILDFISIDVEGIDFDILKAIDYEFIRPTVICIETKEFLGGKENIKEFVEFMQSKNYYLHADTWINTIFVDCNIHGGKLNNLSDLIV